MKKIFMMLMCIGMMVSQAEMGMSKKPKKPKKPITTRQYGDTYYHSDGTKTNRYGDTFYHSSGARTNVYGDSYYHSSDGTRSRRDGSDVLHKDGTKTKSFSGHYESYDSSKFAAPSYEEREFSDCDEDDEECLDDW